MIKKEIPRKYTDLLQVVLYVAILLLFANFESQRKAGDREQEPTVTRQTDVFSPTFAKVKSH